MPREILTPQNAKSLNRIADEFQRIAEQLRNVSQSLGDRGLETIQVTNYSSLQKALVFSGNFAQAAINGMIEAMESRGEFHAASSDSEKMIRKQPGKSKSGQGLVSGESAKSR